ncbi:MAG: alginate O-acetyltransferase complex protein AlgI, partial [Solirubrobacteraceae bacterium]|nr:alginate O-acetyltransferase complex protein AlgI [Solirubrobacteraceae bacterium]
FLYIPLGGNRKGRARTYVNLLATMTLGGLWHGAAWTFVRWGALHGTGLAAEHAIGERRLARVPVWLRWLVVLHFVVLGWVLFRSPDLGSAGEFLGRLVVPGPATLFSLPVVLAVLAVFAVQLVPRDWRQAVRAWVQRRHPVTLGLGLTSVILLVGATVPSQGVPPFIYFQF